MMYDRALVKLEKDRVSFVRACKDVYLFIKDDCPVVKKHFRTEFPGKSFNYIFNTERFAYPHEKEAVRCQFIRPDYTNWSNCPDTPR